MELKYSRSTIDLARKVLARIRGGENFYTAFNNEFAETDFFLDEKEVVRKRVGEVLRGWREKGEQRQSTVLGAPPPVKPQPIHMQGELFGGSGWDPQKHYSN